MEYLLDTDFLAQLTAADFNDLTVPEPDALTTLEALALAEARTVLSPRFNVGLLLAPWFVYDAAATYLPGQRVRTTLGALYVCHTQAPPATALTNADYFTEGDSRPADLVQALVARVVYALHLRLLPAILPAERKQAAEAAQAGLHAWATGSLPAPNWPRHTETAQPESGNSTGQGWL